jgi:hypothetical protein
LRRACANNKITCSNKKVVVRIENWKTKICEKSYKPRMLMTSQMTLPP